MTVRELREALEDMPGNALVVLSKDGEGNEFSPLSELQDDVIYIPESGWSGVIRRPKLTSELAEQGYTEEDVSDEGEVAVVLWPTN